MNNKTIISKGGYNKLQGELKTRKKKREDIADEIDKARQQGDLSENSAYKSALENKEFNENRIYELEKILKHAKIIKKTRSKQAGLGSEIKIRNIKDNNTLEIKLVGEEEADSANNKISILSPLGLALKGQVKGDEVTVDSPIGKTIYKIRSLK